MVLLVNPDQTVHMSTSAVHFDILSASPFL